MPIRYTLTQMHADAALGWVAKCTLGIYKQFYTDNFGSAIFYNIDNLNIKSL